MKKALVTILKYVIFLGLGIWIIYYTLSKLSPVQRTQLLDDIMGVNPLYLFFIGVVGAASHYVRAARWRYLLETIDLRPTLANTMFSVMIGYLANLVLPRAGEVAKCTVLAKYEDMPAHKMVGTIVAERAFDVLSLIIIAVVTFLIEMNRINSYVSGLIDKFMNGHSSYLLILPAVLGLAILGVYIVYRKNKDSKVGIIIKEMTHGILSIFHMKKKWQFLGLTIIMWLLYASQIYLGLLCLPGTHDLPVMASMVVLVYGSLALIVTPGGIGAYPLLVAQILAGPYGADEVTSMAFGWIAWALQTIVIIVLGLLSLAVIHSYNQKRNAQATVDKK